MEVIFLVLPDWVWIPEKEKEFSVFQNLQIVRGPVEHRIRLATVAISSWIKDRGVNQAALLHPVPSLRMCGGIFHSHHMLSHFGAQLNTETLAALLEDITPRTRKCMKLVLCLSTLLDKWKHVFRRPSLFLLNGPYSKLSISVKDVTSSTLTISTPN